LVWLSRLIWTLWFLVQLAMALAMFVAAGPLLFLGLARIHIDALIERRLPWLSWPAMVVLDVGIAWLIARVQLDERRMRRELSDRIKSRALRCPLCEAPLPAWGGVFEECPFEPFAKLWGDRGKPEGCFRLRCESCGCEAWFEAWLDGTVGAHLGWLLENKYKHLL
jgi:hypothetical protein